MTIWVKVLLGLCLLAAIVFGSIEVWQRYEADGRSPYEKLEDELEDEQADRKATFPPKAPAAKEPSESQRCLSKARSERQLRRCVSRQAR